MQPAPTPLVAPWVDAHGRSHLGRERSRNEDTFLVATLRRSMFVHHTNLPGNIAGLCHGANQGTLLVVADGMGGQAGGDLASQLAVESVVKHALNVMPWLSVPSQNNRISAPSLRDQLAGAVVGGDLVLREAAAHGTAPQGLGTTLTAAYILLPVLYLVHVGDSRCYLFRDGKLSRLTRDHTVAEQMFERGVEPDEVPITWHNVLWNAVGAGEDGVHPQTSRIDIQPSERRAPVLGRSHQALVGRPNPSIHHLGGPCCASLRGIGSCGSGCRRQRQRDGGCRAHHDDMTSVFYKFPIYTAPASAATATMSSGCFCTSCEVDVGTPGSSCRWSSGDRSTTRELPERVANAPR